MVSNGTLKEIGEALFAAESVILFPHENPDGDALGSCIALCTALREKGIDCWVLIDETLSDYLAFMDPPGPAGNPCCTVDPECIGDPEICVYIDCCGEDRIPGREEVFRKGTKSICIDHHGTSEATGDLYYIDSEEAATTQIIFQLLKDCGVRWNRKIANAIYTGISTDTGNFQYSNANARTHRIAAELLEIGVDHNDIMVSLYQNVDFRETKLESAALGQVEFFAGGQAAMAAVSQKLLQDTGSQMEHAENLINRLRDIKGVEVGIVLKETKTGNVKASFRAKSWANVGNVAKDLGGGGHVKASGCTLHDTDLETAKRLVMKRVEEELSQ